MRVYVCVWTTGSLCIVKTQQSSVTSVWMSIVSQLNTVSGNIVQRDWEEIV